MKKRNLSIAVTLVIPIVAFLAAFAINGNITNEIVSANPHPFATALREYMAGYDGVVRAYLATLDDDGTIGVLVTRIPTAEALLGYDSGEYG